MARSVPHAIHHFAINTGHSRPAASFPFPFDCASMEHAANGDIVVLGGGTSINVTTAGAGRLRVDVFNSHGDLVAPIADGTEDAGTHTFFWHAGQMPTGIYYVRAMSGGVVRTTELQVQR